MKARVITARIGIEVNDMIQFLKSSLGLPNTTSVLTHAIQALYTDTKEQQERVSSLEMFEEMGLLGCIKGPRNLSTTYKDEITEIISRKCAPRTLAKKTPACKKVKAS